MNKLRKHYAMWKKPDTKGHMLYDCIYMKCSEQANPEAGGPSDCRDWEEAGQKHW